MAAKVVPAPSPDTAGAQLESLAAKLLRLRGCILDYESELAGRIRKAHPAYTASARNLVHYVGLRGRDVRPLQAELAGLGLASLGRSEAHVMATLDAVLRILFRAGGREWSLREPYERFVSQAEGRTMVERHVEALLGGRERQRRVRIMVTLPAEAAEDPSFVHALIAAGMDCARINCARDDPAIWQAMVDNVRSAQRMLGRSCRVLMDLGGPKLRTGDIEAGPAVLKWRPRRDALGRTVEPARVWLCAAGEPCEAPGPAAVLPVAGAWLKRVRVGDTVHFEDARGRRRILQIVSSEGKGRLAQSDRTAYVTPGTALRRVSASRRGRSGAPGTVGDLPHLPGYLTLRMEDELIVSADPTPGSQAVIAEDGQVSRPARVPCTLPEVLADVRDGERIWFDDGKIGGIVLEASPEALRVRIVQADPRGSRLRADKGINLPDSDLNLRGLTEADIAHLDLVARHADLVAMSFIRTPEDVSQLQGELARRGGAHIGIILKIETRRALEQLPAILLTGMRSHPLGVMIARGDLAVEVGFERLPEAQEEILWLCEAAHLPVTWATQVLEGLTKRGVPSRAEVTDAALSVRADCVMLNKGAYLLDALRMLDDILVRMAKHDRKGDQLLGRLDMGPVPAMERAVAAVTPASVRRAVDEAATAHREGEAP